MTATPERSGATLTPCRACSERRHRDCISFQSTPERGFPCNCDCELAWVFEAELTGPSREVSDGAV